MAIFNTVTLVVAAEGRCVAVIVSFRHHYMKRDTMAWLKQLGPSSPARQASAQAVPWKKRPYMVLHWPQFLEMKHGRLTLLYARLKGARDITTKF